MKNYIQSQEFQDEVGDFVEHAFFPPISEADYLDISNRYSVDQVHSNRAVEYNESSPHNIEADAIVTNKIDTTLVIKTADCLPILLVDPISYTIGIIHAGWRGAKSGIIANTLSKMKNIGSQPTNITAAIGPCIRQISYEVDQKFFLDFIIESKKNKIFFEKAGEKFMFNLPGYVKSKLTLVKNVYDCNIDTYNNQQGFVSYRRLLKTGKNKSIRNISTIKLLPQLAGMNEWRFSLKNIKKNQSQMSKVYSQTQSASFTPPRISSPQQKYNPILDLHGYTQEQAFPTLKTFIEQQSANNIRQFLLITGKGAGIIKSNVEKWLKYSELSKYISSFNQAKQQHGGEGALYVFLKKK